MNSPNEPATEQQLAFLEHHGQPAHDPLTRIQAAELIRRIREADGASSPNPTGPYYLGLSFELKKSSQSDLFGVANSSTEVISKRQEFWLDTCREITQMHTGSAQVLELYKMHGCRFALPTNAEVQEVLDALDVAMPAWEMSHAELFYETLELNFPELLKQASHTSGPV